MQRALSSIRRYLETTRKTLKEKEEIKKIKELKHLSEHFIVRMDIVIGRTSEIRYMPTNIDDIQ